MCVWELRQEACKRCTGRWDGEAFASRRGAKGRSEQWELVPRLAFSVPELGPKFGASSVFAKERGFVFVTHFGRIFRTQKHACDSDIVCARHRQSDTAVGIGTWTRNRKTGCAM